MTKKHFIALAQELYRHMPVKGCHHGRGARHNETCFASCYDSWEMIVKGIAATCQQQNAQFNRERFLAACGVTK